MQRSRNFSIKSKITADLFILALIIILTQSFFFYNTHIISGINTIILCSSLGIWFFAARTSGLYDDFRGKPFSYEWVAFLKSFILYALLTTCFLFLFFNDYPFNRRHLVLHCLLVFVLLPVQKVIIRVLIKK